VLFKETELAEIIGQLAGINNMAPEPITDKGHEQLFICACGFEDRALAIPLRLAETGDYKAEHSLILEHMTNKKDNAVNRPTLTRLLTQISSQPQELLYKDEDFAARFASILDSVLSCDDREVPSVSFDISACSSKMVLSTLRMLFERNILLRILYTEASTYHPTLEEFRQSPEDWTVDGKGISKGILTVGASPLYAGLNIDELPILLVAFPTFKPERIRTIIAALQPAKIIWTIGIPHAVENQWRKKAMREINLLSGNEQTYELKTFDYVETFALLEQLYNEYQNDYHMVIAPHGSKLQDVGISLFCMLRQDVELWFSTPESFNPAQYTSGVEDLWQIVIGSTHQVVELVQSYGKLQLR
jgi:hypothetical protein